LPVKGIMLKCSHLIMRRIGKNLIVQIPETVNRSLVLRAIFDRFTRKDSSARIRKLILFFV
jgi:hypothetical protein